MSNPAVCHSLGHSLGHFRGLVFLLEAPLCKVQSFPRLSSANLPSDFDSVRASIPKWSRHCVAQTPGLGPCSIDMIHRFSSKAICRYVRTARRCTLFCLACFVE